MKRFFEVCVSILARQGPSLGHKSVKKMEERGRESASSAEYIQDKDGNLLWEAALVRVRWVRFSDKLLVHELDEMNR